MEQSYNEGYRLSTTDEGLRMEPTKRNPEPLRLDVEALASPTNRIWVDEQHAALER